MSRNRLAAAAAAAAIAILSGCAATHHAAAAPLAHTAATYTATHHAASHKAATHKAATRTAAPAPADPAVQWLASPGGQAQVTFNQDVDTLAGDLETEAHAPTVANHLIFEADARTVRAQADKILSASALLPTVNRAAYQHMLHSFVTVTDMLQPGAGYGTTSQDYTAWWTALNASNIAVS
jgi:hypothetical protein